MPLNRHILPLGIIASVLLMLPLIGDDQAGSPKGAKTLPFADNSSWKPCHFGGDGPIKMKAGTLSLGFGDPLTGVRWEGDFPKEDYEITMESRRVGGFDFFCGLTLPVADQRFSLILGGWGGSLVGLSSIDSMDASNNETMMIHDFKKDRWYKIRVRVTGGKIVVWLDEDEIINVDREGRVFDIRAEMEECTPMGIAAFQCESEVRNVQVRSLKLNPSAQTVEGAAVPVVKE